MKKLIFILTAMVMTAASAFAQNAVPENNYENYIQVSGKSEKEIVPDEIYVRIVVSEENLKSKQSVEKVEQQMIRDLKALGIDTDRDLRIDNMSSSYKNYVFNKNNPKTTAIYELKVNGAVMLGRVFQAMENLGLSNMSITKLSHSKIKEYQDEARVEAMKNARQVAQSLAEAVGQKAGRAIYIVDYNNDIYLPVMERADVMYAKQARDTVSDYQTELEFKNIKITYSVTAKFALE